MYRPWVIYKQLTVILTYPERHRLLPPIENRDEV